MLLSGCMATLAALIGATSCVRAEELAPEQRLFHAIVQNEVVLVEQLLKSGIKPDARVRPAAEDRWVLNPPDSDPAPPLLVVAARFGCLDDSKTIRLLLAHGANVNIRDTRGRTPLMMASELTWNPSVRLLIEHGADVNVKDRSGQTPLMLAMGNLGEGVAALLLEKGADIDARDRQGQTPLMIALRRAQRNPIRIYGRPDKPEEDRANFLSLIDFLIAKGADLFARDNAGKTALEQARERHLDDIQKRLEAAMAKPVLFACFDSSTPLLHVAFASPAHYGSVSWTASTVFWPGE